MLFQTPPFLALMAAVIAALVLIRLRALQLAVLLLASYVFYMSWNPAFILLLLSITLTDYGVGRALGRVETPSRRKAVLAVSIVANLAALAVFKYSDFFLTTINHGLAAGGHAALPLLRITLPVGISFYTFQSMGYTIDVYRRRIEPERSLPRFALFVAFFPQLLSGPITRAGMFLPQFDRPIGPRAEGFRRGCNLLLAGLLKKVVVADTVAPLADHVFSAPRGLASLEIMLGAVAFGIQIYGDFSGYTDMARGAALMLGFELPVNFRFPYLARSLTDFWRRWHISLSTWLRDYLYISFGGNRGGRLRTYRNLMLTMLLGGLWHGAAWNFVVWGAFHGAVLAGERALGLGRNRNGDGAGGLGRLRRAGAWLVCQYLVFLGWLIFRVRDPDNLIYCVKKYVLFDFRLRLFNHGLGEINPFLVGAVMLGFVVVHAWSAWTGGLAEALDRAPRPWQWLAWLAGVFVLVWLWPAAQTSFIYFQF